MRDGKGLGHVIIGTEGESPDDLLVTGPGCQHDDRLFRIVGAQPVANFKPVDPGKHNVQKYQIEATGKCFFKTAVAIRGSVYFIAVKQENIHQSITDSLLIFNDQNAVFSLHISPVED